MVQASLPFWFSTPEARVGPNCNVEGVSPSSNTIETVPLTEAGSQMISKVDPTFRVMSFAGAVMASKPAVCAKAVDTNAKTAAETKEVRILNE